MKFHHLFALSALLVATATAAEPALSAKDLAAKMSAQQQDGSTYFRLKMTTKGAGTQGTIQAQIKQRRTGNSTELVYQILWPKDRAGEAVLLKRSGNSSSGTALTPPAKLTKLSSSTMDEPLLGTALTRADVLENFFSWENQTISGSEKINRIECQVLDSRPAKGESATATGVRSWIDTNRMIPLRVEKYDASGKTITRIDTNRVLTDEKGRNLPADMTITNSKTGAVTELEGSKLKHDISYEDADFTPGGLTQMSPPKS
jgi:hypothetical protein